MYSNHSDEPDNGNDQVDDPTMADENEEQSKTSSFTFRSCEYDVPGVDSCFNNDYENDDDGDGNGVRMSGHAGREFVGNDAQSSLPHV